MKLTIEQLIDWLLKEMTHSVQPKSIVGHGAFVHAFLKAMGGEKYGKPDVALHRLMAVELKAVDKLDKNIVFIGWTDGKIKEVEIEGLEGAGEKE